jgi:hypothetical protein
VVEKWSCVGNKFSFKIKKMKNGRFSLNFSGHPPKRKKG